MFLVLLKVINYISAETFVTFFIVKHDFLLCFFFFFFFFKLSLRKGAHQTELDLSF